MNQIAIWSNIKGYGDWCYNYRIPSKEEFVEEFKYDFREFQMTEGGKSNHNPTIYTVYWKEYTVGNNKDHKHVEKFLQQYLEAGYIRVKHIIDTQIKKANERINNNKKSIMKLFYYKIEQMWTLERDSETDDITKYINDHEKELDILYLVTKAETSSKGFEDIQKKYCIETLNNKRDSHLFNLKGKEAYQISELGIELTKDKFNSINCPIDKVFVTPEAMHDFSELWPKNEVIKEKKQKLNGWELFKQYFRRSTKIVPKHQTILDTINKYPSRMDPITHRYKPLHTLDEIKNHLYNHQPEKSPNRLVCIATKDKKEFKRIPWKEANELITTQLADEKEWDYISKKEFRALSKPKPLLSFTPALEDKGIYKEHKKTIPNKSSSKKAKCKRNKKHPNYQQGIKQSKIFHEYEVILTHTMKEGSMSQIYTIFATNENKASNRAINRFFKENPEVEYHRTHGTPNLPLFRPTIKRLDKSSINAQPKKESLTTRLIMPHVIDLPIRKDKTGKVIPWTKKTVIVNEKGSKEPFSIIDEEIKTYTKYEVSYDRKDISPFKKAPKKWKCPIPEYKTKRYLKRKQQNNKNVK